MFRPTILSVVMLAIGVVLGAGGFAVGQKAADRSSEPGRYTANMVLVFGGIGVITEVTDHQTNTLYLYAQPAATEEGREMQAAELFGTIDLTSAGQAKLKATYVNLPKKDDSKKNQPKR